MGLVAPGIWDLPRPGMESMSPALAGGFLTTEPPGRPQNINYFNILTGDSGAEIRPNLVTSEKPLTQILQVFMGRKIFYLKDTPGTLVESKRKETRREAVPI